MTTIKDYVKLTEAWGDLLDVYDWDQFCTFTYCASVWSQEKVIRDFKRTHYIAAALETGCSKNNRTHRNKHRNEKLPPYVLAIEPHQSGTLHAHALVGSASSAAHGTTSLGNTISKRHLELAWQDNVRNAGFTSITPVRKSASARSYIVKTSRYCVKNPNAYLDWYGLGNANSSLTDGSHQSLSAR
jgi:hypothetical protein